MVPRLDGAASLNTPPVCMKIFMPHVGEYATSMEMAGLSVTVFKLDDQLKELLAAPAKTPFYTNWNK